jgi:uncharacterized membrane protein
MNELLLLYIAGAVMLMLLALPLLCEKVPPNRLYGFRVRATLEDRTLWYAVNRYAARRLIWSGAALLAVAVILYVVPGLTLDAYAWSCAVVALGGLAVSLVQSFRYLNALARPKERPRG